jgi:DNA mismatch endonuclease (patch repair protein)
MADIYSKKRRSEIMAGITSRDTKPEVSVRRVLHRMGYRFRLHRKDLPGRPDIVLRKWRVVVLVHGCFWHGHDCCEGHLPKSNAAYWAPKLEKNQRRDIENAKLLASLGWKLIVIWECQTYSLKKLEERLREAMPPTEEKALHQGTEAWLLEQPSPNV